MMSKIVKWADSNTSLFNKKETQIFGLIREDGD